VAHDFYSEQLTQCLAIPVAAIAPANTSNSVTAVLSSAITANQFMRYFGILNVGVLTGAANVSLYWTASNTSGGTYTNVSSTNAVAFSNTANTTLTVECRVDQLPTNGTSFLKLNALVAANAAFISGNVIAVAMEYSPASQFNYNTNNTTLVQLVV
jgi:hypothetical protein